MIQVSKSDIVRFVKKITYSETGCWEWSAGKDRYGYGVFQMHPKQVKAHRFSYFVLGQHASKIPLATSVKYESISHLCDNNVCVNPEHLIIEPIQKKYTPIY